MSDSNSRRSVAQRRPQKVRTRERASVTVGEDTSGERESIPSISGRGRRRSRGPMAIVVALAVAAAIGVGAFFGFQGDGADPVADQISAQESQTLQGQYSAMLASGGIEVDMVGADEVDQAIASMPVSDEQRTEVQQKVQSGQMRLAWLTLWDTHAQDGDILRFESDAALPVEVMALNAPTTLAIPFPASGTVKVTGVVDGGGGITIALKSGAAQIAWPTMQPGDTLSLPVTPGL